MIYERSTLAVAIFAVFVGITLGLSFYLGRRAKSASGYFAAGGGIHWFVNGIAFAGDYLSAASFLGICGMIAFYGYDGFLYSVGYLAGWIVALFVVAEPLKRMGKFTFADALDSQFHSRGIKLTAAISTLAVSIFYLIPQMVGAGALIKPLLGFSHATGVITVGAVVILIVTTAGMVSTTYVQFIKGSLLVIFSTVLVVMILNRGLSSKAEGEPVTKLVSALIGDVVVMIREDEIVTLRHTDAKLTYGDIYDRSKASFVKFLDSAVVPRGEFEELPASASDKARRIVRFKSKSDERVLTWLELSDPPVCRSSGSYVARPNGPVTLQLNDKQYALGALVKLNGGQHESGSLNPIEFIREFSDSEILTWPKQTVEGNVLEGRSKAEIYFPKYVAGKDLLLPGNHPTFKGIRSDKLTDKLNFLSLMLALFGGTASLPHILIRYYTVKDQASARKSTIVGIASIGFFYVLTLYIGLGAMTSGALDVTNSNMAAPLLAKSFSEWLFAVISAIAFTTVLGTVSGLIIAASGAVAHDICGTLLKMEMTDFQKIRIAKIASVAVGIIAIVLGILFEKMNVSYLVGWAFSVAASANLPSLIMLIFWKGTTKQGITAAITVGVISSLSWILLSADTFKDVYGLDPAKALVPFSQPGIVTIPLGFAVLIGVSLLTRRREVAA